MKSINQFLSESKKLDTNIELKDFSHDLYNTLSSLLFEYHMADKSIDKDQFSKEIENFIDKFYEENDDE